MEFETRSQFGRREWKDPRTGEWITDNAEADRRAKVYDAEEKKSQGLNPDGSPQAITRESLLDPATGLLKAAYQFKGQTVDPNSLEGYQAIKKEATRTGPSQWLNLAQQKQQLEQAQANDSANSGVMAGNAQARSTLAMRGGLSAGARERLGSQMQRDMVGARQKVAGEGILARANLNVQDEQNRLGQLQNFANAEGQLTKYNTDISNRGQEFNILQGLQEGARGDEWKMRQYEEQMKKWAAGKQADATAASGGGSGGK